MATSGLDASCQDRLLARVLHDRIKAGANSCRRLRRSFCDVVLSPNIGASKTGS